jgi:hypothetical protein
MRDLERELHELGTAIAVPATPDIAGEVRTRLTVARVGRRRRRLVLALALLAAVLVGLAASPARTAILRFFGVGAVGIELVDRLPSVRPSAPITAGRQIDPAETPFRLLRSDLLGKPDRVYVDGDVVTLLYGSPERVRLLVTQIGTAELAPELVKKLGIASTEIRFVELAGLPEPALWIEGEPHVVVLPDAPPRLASNTLVWVQSGRTLRIEGALDEPDAVRIAESFR